VSKIWEKLQARDGKRLKPPEPPKPQAAPKPRCTCKLVVRYDREDTRELDEARCPLHARQSLATTLFGRRRNTR
jgi:hypothetical protein